MRYGERCSLLHPDPMLLLVALVPLGLLIAGAIFVAQGLFLPGLGIAALAVPFIVLAVVLRRAAAARDRAGVARTIQQLQDGTHVPEWQRRV